MRHRAFRLLLPYTGVMYALTKSGVHTGSMRHMPAVTPQQGICHAALSRVALSRTQRSFRTAAVQTEEQAQGPPYEGLQRIPFDPDYENFVALTGTMDNPTRMINGDYCFTLSVKRHQQQQLAGTPDVYERYKVVVTGAKAISVQAEVQKDMMLQVLGKLRMDDQQSIKIMADDVDIVDVASPQELEEVRTMRQQQPQQQQQEPSDLQPDQPYEEYEQPPAAAAAPYSAPVAATSGGGVGGGIPHTPKDDKEAAWLDLFANPSGWWDNRSKKVGKQPDFKQKSGEGALWIDNRQTPEWVLQNLQQLPGGIPYTPPAGGSSSRASSQPAAQMDFLPSAPSSEKEAAWVDVFTNYRGWWDNRMNKRNPRAPDFKQKQGDTALWISSYDTPPWVLQHVETALPQPPPPKA